MDKRPELNLNLDSETFRNYYYLKEELMKFCRDNGLPSSGNKKELTERIAHYLDTGEITKTETTNKTKILNDISLGTIIEEKNVNVTLDDIKKVFNNFPKSYNQTVPKYSAVKINGKKLYEYARNNIDIKLPVRKVEIYSLELLDFDGTSITFKIKV